MLDISPRNPQPQTFPRFAPAEGCSLVEVSQTLTACAVLTEVDLFCPGCLHGSHIVLMNVCLCLCC